MSPNGTTTSKTGTINSRNGTYKSATRTGGRDGSFDSLADKTMNSTVEEDLRSSFDMYDPHSTLGSHLAPVSSFVDTHDVHYASGNNPNPISYAPNIHHNATVHSATGYNYDYATQASNEWNR